MVINLTLPARDSLARAAHKDIATERERKRDAILITPCARLYSGGGQRIYIAIKSHFANAVVEIVIITQKSRYIKREAKSV